MKFISAVVFLNLIAASAAVSPVASLLKSARKLEAAAEENEFSFLESYSLKLIRCKKDTTYISPVDGSYEYSSVVFRLCPAECDNDSTAGCTSGFGDYVVGLNTFASAYLEAKKDEMLGDDANNDWKWEKFGECQAWEVDRDAEIEEGLAFYVGPECTEDETSVKLALFSDGLCETETEDYTFEQISNGVSLPYSSGGLVGNYCETCYGANDRGEYEISDMCMNLWTYSGKCESQMETTHYIGKNEESCETIMSMMPASVKKAGTAGRAIGWIVFGLVVFGIIGFAVTKMQKKEDDKKTGLMA